MDARQILQCELWSKRTTRRSLVGLGVTVGLIVFGFWIANEVELHWLTSGERSAARAALAQIDSLDDAQSLSIGEYGFRKARAEASVGVAKATVRTGRDVFLCTDLDSYLAGVELKREWKRGSSSKGEQTDNRLKSDLNETIRTQRLALHRVLD